MPTPSVRQVRIRVGPYDLHVRVAGSGRPLLLIHGARSSSELLAPQIDGLAAAFTVYAPDLPGHGDSPLVGDRLPDIRAVLMGLVTELGLFSFAVAGFSRGGVPAIELAVHHAPPVNALVLACPAGLSVIEGAIPHEAPSPALLGHRLMAPLFANPACATEGFSAMMRRNVQRTAAYERLRATGAPHEPDLSAELRHISVPCLILWGSDDQVMPASNADRFRAAIPGAQLHMFPGLRHLFHYEAPEEFNRQVRTFLETVGAGCAAPS
jgi:pimeloyl-ACP methyl ester carboxylesterase